MLDKTLLEEILGIAVSTGADFAEVYSELTRNGNIRLLDGKIDSITDNTVSGVGIRAFLGTRTVYASTSDTSREGLLACAASVATAMGDKNIPANVKTVVLILLLFYRSIQVGLRHGAGGAAGNVGSTALRADICTI